MPNQEFIHIYPSSTQQDIFRVIDRLTDGHNPFDVYSEICMTLELAQDYAGFYQRKANKFVQNALNRIESSQVYQPSDGDPLDDDDWLQPQERLVLCERIVSLPFITGIQWEQAENLWQETLPMLGFLERADATISFHRMAQGAQGDEIEHTFSYGNIEILVRKWEETIFHRDPEHVVLVTPEDVHSLQRMYTASIHDEAYSLAREISETAYHLVTPPKYFDEWMTLGETLTLLGRVELSEAKRKEVTGLVDELMYPNAEVPDELLPYLCGYWLEVGEIEKEYEVFGWKMSGAAEKEVIGRMMSFFLTHVIDGEKEEGEEVENLVAALRAKYPDISENDVDELLKLGPLWFIEESNGIFDETDITIVVENPYFEAAFQSFPDAFQRFFDSVRNISPSHFLWEDIKVYVEDMFTYYLQELKKGSFDTETARSILRMVLHWRAKTEVDTTDEEKY